KPGLYMPAHPAVGVSGRQEYLKGHAEDHYRVRALNASVTTPALSSAHALLTEEWSPLEPGVLDHKLYVRGVGIVLDQTVKGGDERNALLSVGHPCRGLFASVDRALQLRLAHARAAVDSEAARLAVELLLGAALRPARARAKPAAAARRHVGPRQPRA